MPGILKTTKKEMKEKNLVLLTGAPGYVGGRLLKALEESQFHLRWLVRRPELLHPRVSLNTEVVKGMYLSEAVFFQQWMELR